MPDKAESEALASYWLQQIEAWPSSGQTQHAYCKSNDLSYHRFGYWRRKFRQQSQEVQSQKGSGFVPVTHSATFQSAGLSLAFPSGLVLRGIAGDNLPIVYQLLSRLS
jgi:transposase